MTRFFSLENLSSKKIEKMMIDEFFCGYLYISRTQNLRNMKPGLGTWMPSLIKKSRSYQHINTITTTKPIRSTDFQDN